MKLFAFWNYDQYPYVLGAEVEELKGDSVRPKGYGGYTFKHIHITDYESGVVIKDQLDYLKVKFEKERLELSKSYREQAKKIAPFIWVKN